MATVTKCDCCNEICTGEAYLVSWHKHGLKPLSMDLCERCWGKFVHAADETWHLHIKLGPREPLPHSH